MGLIKGILGASTIAQVDPYVRFPIHGQRSGSFRLDP